MGLGRFELPTSRLSGVRSNHLSYRPARLPQKGAAEFGLHTPDAPFVAWLPVLFDRFINNGVRLCLVKTVHGEYHRSCDASEPGQFSLWLSSMVMLCKPMMVSP